MMTTRETVRLRLGCGNCSISGSKGWYDPCLSWGRFHIEAILNILDSQRQPAMRWSATHPLIIINFLLEVSAKPSPCHANCLQASAFISTLLSIITCSVIMQVFPSLHPNSPYLNQNHKNQILVLIKAPTLAKEGQMTLPTQMWCQCQKCFSKDYRSYQKCCILHHLKL